jgi:hypothetical protein
MRGCEENAASKLHNVTVSIQFGSRLEWSSKAGLSLRLLWLNVGGQSSILDGFPSCHLRLDFAPCPRNIPLFSLLDSGKPRPLKLGLGQIVTHALVASVYLSKNPSSPRGMAKIVPNI